MKRNAPGCQGSGLCLQGCRENSVRAWTSRTSRGRSRPAPAAPARARERILMKGKRAVAVEATCSTRPRVAGWARSSCARGSRSSSPPRHPLAGPARRSGIRGSPATASRPPGHPVMGRSPSGRHELRRDAGLRGPDARPRAQARVALAPAGCCDASAGAGLECRSGSRSSTTTRSGAPSSA